MLRKEEGRKVYSSLIQDSVQKKKGGAGERERKKEMKGSSSRGQKVHAVDNGTIARLRVKAVRRRLLNKLA